jgi:hypothetical protein
MNEHIRRVHDGFGLSMEDFEKLESCQGWKLSQKNSFRAVTESSVEVGVDFRMESMFESKVGLLRSSIVFCDGEEARIGSHCLGYFRNHKEANPFFQPVVQFLQTADTLCRRVGSDHCRQQALRDAEGNTSCACFRPVQLSTVHKYAATVAHLIYFATKCPWDYPVQSGDWDVPSALDAIFFEPHRSIQQNFVTR